MNIIFIVCFIAVFAVVALVLSASGSNAAKEAKQVLATLDSALADSRTIAREGAVDLRRSEMLSAIPWMHRTLMKIELAPRLRTLLNQANLKWTAGRMILGSLICFLVSTNLLYLRLHVLVVALLLGALVGFAPLGYVLHRRSKRFAKFEQQLPDSLELMVSALRVGHSLNAALGLVTRESPEPLRGEFRICYDEQNYGLELRTAMENLNNRVPLQDLRIVTTAILIQKESGGNLAEVLDKTAHVIRERFRLKRQIMTHTAQGRMTGWILSVLPVALGIALYFVNPETMSLLWTRAIGVKLLYASAAMTIIGSLIIRKIVNMKV